MLQGISIFGWYPFGPSTEEMVMMAVQNGVSVLVLLLVAVWVISLITKTKFWGMYIPLRVAKEIKSIGQLIGLVAILAVNTAGVYHLYFNGKYFDEYAAYALALPLGMILATFIGIDYGKVFKKVTASVKKATKKSDTGSEAGASA